jgi:hypothetical protein
MICPSPTHGLVQEYHFVDKCLTRLRDSWPLIPYLIVVALTGDPGFHGLSTSMD